MKLVELYMRRQNRRRDGEKKANERFTMTSSDGDVYLMLNFYSTKRGISARNIHTRGIVEFPCNLLVIPC